MIVRSAVRRPLLGDGVRHRVTVAPAFYNDTEGYWMNEPLVLGQLGGTPSVGTTWGPYPFRMQGVVKDQGGTAGLGDWYLEAANGGEGGLVRITIDQMVLRATGPAT